jgi:replicative DNA helicase
MKLINLIIEEGKLNKLKEQLKAETFSVTKSIQKFVEQNNRMTNPLDTPFEFLKWLDEGRLIVIGGGSGLGKTAFVLQLIYELVKNNQDREDGDVLGIYATAEMSIEELTMRLIVNQSVFKEVNMLNVRKFFNSKLVSPDELKERIAKTDMILSDIPFYFLNASKFQLEQIIELIKFLRENNPTKRIFVVIDYLQILLLYSKNLQEINQLIMELKTTLTEYKANAIVISALNRDASRLNYVDMTAFKESGMIEYTADIAALFCFGKKNEKSDKINYQIKMPEEYRDRDDITLYLRCVKNRIGSFFNLKLRFNKKLQRFFIIENDTDDILANENENNQENQEIQLNREEKQEIKSLKDIDPNKAYDEDELF